MALPIVISVKRHGKIIALTLLAVGAGLGFYQRAHFQSWLWVHKKQFLYDRAIGQERKSLTELKALTLPIAKSKTSVSLNTLPGQYQSLLAVFNKPEIVSAQFGDKTEGWIIQDGRPRLRKCPTFPNEITKNFSLTLRKSQSHLNRYEYISRQNVVIAETRMRAFTCEVEVFIKTLPTTRL